MPGSLTIGDFSRVTFLSVKTLRHYHRVGLLEPHLAQVEARRVRVDPHAVHRAHRVGAREAHAHVVIEEDHAVADPRGILVLVVVFVLVVGFVLGKAAFAATPLRLSASDPDAVCADVRCTVPERRGADGTPFAVDADDTSVVILRKGKIVAYDKVERLRDLMQQPSLEGI